MLAPQASLLPSFSYEHFILPHTYHYHLEHLLQLAGNWEFAFLGCVWKFTKMRKIGLCTKTWVAGGRDLLICFCLSSDWECWTAQQEAVIPWNRSACISSSCQEGNCETRTWEQVISVTGGGNSSTDIKQLGDRRWLVKGAINPITVLGTWKLKAIYTTQGGPPIQIS